MSLAPGSRLGGYEIIALIGAGGMGEVYRARDGKLTRDVALKVLPELFARDHERLARFTREANLLATLNHPNIAAIYGFESANQLPALVLEMVEGPTLADRIRQGPIPIEDALPLAKQIAEALEAAHARGIVHRDLKPANIKVRDDGMVKVLDFGLAKAMASDSSPAIVATSPTITSPAMTAMGAVMGTAAYMSPEQARGRAIDKRSDIWAFGAVLYEMLTGRRAFDGDDVSETLANILKSDPDWSALPPTTSRSVEKVLRRCLAKEPHRRMHDMADVRLELDDRTAVDGAVAPVVTRSPLAKWLERAAWLALVTALGALAWFVSQRPRPTEQIIRFQISAPPTYRFGSLTGMVTGIGAGGGALSPDGSRFVYYASDKSGNSALFVRHLDAFESRQLPGTEGATQPFWSPDGRFIGFLASQKMFVVEPANGDVREVCAVRGIGRGASWGSGGVIVFSTSNPTQILRVPANGGEATPIKLANAETLIGAPSWPFFLPDGRHFLYWARTNTQAESAIHVTSIESGAETTPLTPSSTQAVYVEPGYLIFTRGAQLFRQSFDAASLRLSGSAVPIVDRLRTFEPIGLAEYTASNTGALAYRSGTDLSNQFAWVKRSGEVEQLIGPAGNYRTPALSPDGQRLVYTDSSDGNLKLLELRRGLTTVLTTTPGFETGPVWAGNDRIYYRSDNGGIFSVDSSGTSQPEKVMDGTVNGPSQYLDHPQLGKLLLYFGTLPKRMSQDILIVPLAGKPEPRAIVDSPNLEVEPQVSPNGRWLAYASNQGGRNEVFVEPFPPDRKRRWRVSKFGGRQPLWRQDGRELFFVADDQKFYAVAIPENPTTFELQADFLFDMNAHVYNGRNSYIPGADGTRFLVNTLREIPDAPINVVFNLIDRAK